MNDKRSKRLVLLRKLVRACAVVLQIIKRRADRPTVVRKLFCFVFFIPFFGRHFWNYRSQFILDHRFVLINVWQQFVKCTSLKCFVTVCGCLRKQHQRCLSLQAHQTTPDGPKCGWKHCHQLVYPHCCHRDTQHC